jgi:hypothetical protein
MAITAFTKFDPRAFLANEKREGALPKLRNLRMFQRPNRNVSRLSRL